MKKILLSMFTIALVLLLVACGSSDDICPVCEVKVDFANQAFCPNCGHPFGSVKAEGYTDSDGELYEYEEVDSSGDSGEIIGAYTLEQAAEKGGIYVKKGTDFYSIDSYRLYLDSLNQENYGFGYFGLDNMVPLVFAEGDLLVTFDSEENYDIYPVGCSFYCYPFSIAKVTDDGINFQNGKNQLTKLKREETGYERYDIGYVDKWEDGEELEAALGEFLWMNDCFLFRRFICTFSRTPINLTVPYYSGTQYMEYDVPVSAEMCYLLEPMNVPVERTTDGYFIIDTSMLSSGKYAIALKERLVVAGAGFDYPYFSVFEISGKEETNGSALLGSWNCDTDLNFKFYDDERLEITEYDYIDDYDDIVDDDYTYSEREYYDENGQLQVGIVGECKRTYLYKDYGLGIEIYDSMDNEGGFYEYSSGWYELDTTGTKLTLNTEYYTYELERVD